MTDNKIRGYIEVTCTCGTSRKVCVTQEPQVERIAPGDVNIPCRSHDIVFYCPGCGRKKTAEYCISDVKTPVTCPGEKDEPAGVQ